jgi:hypothetical protein
MTPKGRNDRTNEHRQLDMDQASDARDSVKNSIPPAANDNSIAWPLIPFPEGWHAS